MSARRSRREHVDGRMRVVAERGPKAGEGVWEFDVNRKAASVLWSSRLKLSALLTILLAKLPLSVLAPV